MLLDMPHYELLNKLPPSTQPKHLTLHGPQGEDEGPGHCQGRYADSTGRAALGFIAEKEVEGTGQNLELLLLVPLLAPV